MTPVTEAELEASLIRLFPKLVGYLSTIVGNEAEDVAQETCMKLLEKCADIDARGASSLAYKIAHDLGVNWLRRRGRRGESPLSSDLVPAVKEGSPVEELSAKEFRTMVMEEFLRLPADQQSALYLRENEGMNYREIADQLGSTLAQVKVWIHRGRMALTERVAMGGTGRITE